MERADVFAMENRLTEHCADFYEGVRARMWNSLALVTGWWWLVVVYFCDGCCVVVLFVVGDVWW